MPAQILVHPTAINNTVRTIRLEQMAASHGLTPVIDGHRVVLMPSIQRQPVTSPSDFGPWGGDAA